MEDVEAIVRELNKTERDVAVALLGNAWEGSGKPSPGIMLMNARELMHIDALKGADGSFRRYKARPTPAGQSVRTYLLSQTKE